MKTSLKTTVVLAALCSLNASSAHAATLVTQLGILDLAANGGINPNTGVAWAAGDQYRLAFHTSGTIAATSNLVSDYDDFATAQAQSSTLGNGAISSLSGWTALVWVNTNPNQAQGDALSASPQVRAGMTDVTGGAGVGGAGVPVFAMNGKTSIARNNADVADGWSDGITGGTIRLASGSMNLDSNGNTVTASQNVFYTPFLDQFGLGDTANIHGRDVATGGTFTGHVNALGDITLLGSELVNHSRGNSNPNNGGAGGRAWNRFTDANTTLSSIYVMSPLLTVTLIPEPSTGLLGLIGGLFLLRRRRK